MSDDKTLVERLRADGAAMYVNELRSSERDAAIYREWKVNAQTAADRIAALEAALRAWQEFDNKPSLRNPVAAIETITKARDLTRRALGADR
mgnify:CR=1 FL=1